MKKEIAFRSKIGVSLLIDTKTIRITLLLAFLTLAVFVISTGVGTLRIHPADVLKVFAGIGSDQHSLIIHSFRLPRNLVAIMAGTCLAVSGAILQGIIRNPLASPDIIGVTGGASVAAVGFVTVFQAASIFWLPFVACIGAAVITLLIYGLAWKKGASPLRIVLIGIGIQAAAHALTTFLIVISPIHMSSRALIWLTGSIYGTNWGHVTVIFLWMLVFLPLSYILGRSVNAQQLGTDIAKGIGNPVERHRFLLLLISAALAGGAIAIGGAIGFVALLAPHIAVKLVGPVFGRLLPTSALVGALVVLLADTIARIAFSPLDLPVGIFTSAVGAPFFAYLLYRHRNM